uniref:Uncharacterized protein n=1 Tax=Anguilla anguilla TaxID=7936 RepID=A0A0E9V7Y5_ANGAN
MCKCLCVRLAAHSSPTLSKYLHTETVKGEGGGLWTIQTSQLHN